MHLAINSAGYLVCQPGAEPSLCLLGAGEVPVLFAVPRLGDLFLEIGRDM